MRKVYLIRIYTLTSIHVHFVLYNVYPNHSSVDTIIYTHKHTCQTHMSHTHSIHTLT